MYVLRVHGDGRVRRNILHAHDDVRDSSVRYAHHDHDGAHVNIHSVRGDGRGNVRYVRYARVPFRYSWSFSFSSICSSPHSRMLFTCSSARL